MKRLRKFFVKYSANIGLLELYRIAIAGHDEEEEGHEEHEKAPYAAKVVEVIAYNGDNVAIKGLKAGEEYVSDGIYFVKSMILKSSLGEHGH